MAKDDLTLQIGVETQKAIAALDRFQKDASQALGGISKSFDVLKGAAVAAVAFMAAKGVAEFFGEGIKAAEAQEDAMRKLATAMDATGENTDAAMKHFVEFANQMEATTKYGDDVVLNQVAIAKSFGLTNDQAEELVKTAADLAAATGQDLDSAVQQLGKSYSGATKELGKQIPAVEQLTEAQKKNGEVVKLVAERYGGSAQKEILTFSGAIHQAKNAVGNFAESFGTIIVQNPTLIAAINAVHDTFAFLEEAVNANSDTIGAWVTGAVQVAAATAAGASTALAELADIFTATTGAVLEGIAAFSKGAAGILSFVPGADAAAQSMANFGDEMSTAADETTLKLGAVTQGLNAFEAKVTAGAEKVITADNKIAESAKKAAPSRHALGKAIGETAKEIEKLREEAAKFDEQLHQSTADDEANIKAKLQEQLDEIDKFEKKKIYYSKQAEELRVIAVGAAMEKIGKLEEEKTKKVMEEAEKQAAVQRDVAEKVAATQRAAVEKAASNPISFIIDVKKLDLSPLQQQVAGVGVGLLSKMLEGAAGAKSLISEAAGTFADALLPGIGPAVTSVVSKLAEGPEATKKFIKEFIDAMPEIMDAVGEAMPAVAEGFVDGMVNHGGAERWAKATLRAMFLEGTFKSLGKQLGLEFGNAFNGSQLVAAAKRFGGVAAEAIRNAGQAIGAKIAASFHSGAAAAGLSVSNAMKSAMDVGAAAWHRLVSAAGQLTATRIKEALQRAARAYFIELPQVLSRALFVQLPVKIREGFVAGWLMARDAIIDGFKAGVEAIKAGLKAALDAIGQGLSVIGDGLATAVQRFGEIVTSIPDVIGQAFQSVVSFLQYDVPAAWKAAGAAISDGFKNAMASVVTEAKELGGAWSEAVRGAIGDAVAAAKETVGGFIASVKETIGGVFEPFLTALHSFDWPHISEPTWLFDFVSSVDDLLTTPQWLQPFVDAINALTDWSPPGSDGGHGIIPFSHEPTATNPLGFAKGITEIPPGYPNDSFIAGLQSGERVIDADTNTDLKRALEQGGLGGGADVISLLSRIAAALETRETVTQVSIDGNAVAKAVHSAQYRNARLAR